MPKSTQPPSPISKPSSSSRMSDVAIRKKKNADAQAAFRARRANYIATLEETGSTFLLPPPLSPPIAHLFFFPLVTSLESVVLQLQDSCRESRNEVLELRQENDRLRLENRERDKFWRAHYQARKTGHPPESDDHPSSLSSPFLGQAQVNGMSSHQTGPLIQHPFANGLGYRNEDYNPTGASNFAAQSSSVPFSNNESSSDVASALNHRGQKYSGHPYCLPGPRDPRWSVQSALNGESATSPHSQSPTYIDSPSLATTDMSFTGRFPGEEQKVALSSMLDNAPYVFPNGDRFRQNVADSIPNRRSLSPTSSTPGSSTSVPLTSSFQFSFSEQSNTGQDRTEFDYRRQSLPHCPEVTLHGGTADISLTGQSVDAVRYRIGGHPNDSGVDHRAIIPASENGDHGSSDGDPPFNHLRRNTIRSSRSPSPSAAPISCTVAVIKAQAFGALRRTRARTKKASEGAAKVAMNVLEARGIGIGVPSKRPRLQDDEDLDVETP